MDAEHGCCWRCDSVVTCPEKCSKCDTALYCSEDCRDVDAMCHMTRECRMIALKLCGYCEEKGDDTLMCSGCSAIRYCSRECQRMHWKLEHKQKCETHKMMTHQMANKLRLDFRRQTYLQRCLKDATSDTGVETTALPFAVDLLKLPQNELTLDNNGIDQYKVLTLMGNFLATVHFTGFSLPDDFAQKVMFSHVEGSISTAARDVLLLYILITKPSSAGPIAEIIPVLWFSFRLTTEVAEFLKSTLTDLAGMDLNQFMTKSCGHVVLKTRHFKKMRQVWAQWRDAVCLIDCDDSVHLAQKRKNAITRLETLKGVEEYREFLPELHIPSVDQWFANGNFFLPAGQFQGAFTNYNPLFIDQQEPTDTPATSGHVPQKPRETKFALRCDWMPFKVFDYVSMTRSFDETPVSAVELVSKFVSKMAFRIQKLFSNHQLKIKINFPINKSDSSARQLIGNNKFDRIFFSACFTDAAGVSRLLDDHRDLMNPENPMAVVILETTQWYSLHNSVRGLKKDDIIHTAEDVHFAVAKNSTYLPESQVMGLQSMVVEVVNYLRAEHLAYGQSKEGGTAALPMGPASSDLLPKLTEVFEKGGRWSMRDFRRMRNKVVPFMFRVHRRPMNNLTGRNRFLEFAIGKKK